MRRIVLFGLALTVLPMLDAGDAAAQFLRRRENVCLSDAMRFCGRPARPRSACLASHRNELSPACRAAVRRAFTRASKRPGVRIPLGRTPR